MILLLSLLPKRHDYQKFNPLNYEHQWKCMAKNLQVEQVRTETVIFHKFCHPSRQWPPGISLDSMTGFAHCGVKTSKIKQWCDRSCGFACHLQESIPVRPGVAIGLPLMLQFVHTPEYRSVEECGTSFTFPGLFTLHGQRIVNRVVWKV